MKVFIAGSRSIPTLSVAVERRIDSLLNTGATILVGDANGADTLVQTYLHDCDYAPVVIYASNEKVRNNIGDWRVEHVYTKLKPGTYAFYVAKDKKMAEDADYGFMIWDGNSRGTKNNVDMLLDREKGVAIYYTPHQKFYDVKSKEQFSSFLSQIHHKQKKSIGAQLSLFD